MKFGMVGTGYWAGITHGAALAGEASVDFVGVWGRDQARATAFAERFGVRSYAHYDDLLADVEALTFSVPPDVQVDLAIRAAGAGKHLLLEKPVATTVEASVRLEAAVQAAGVASVVFFTSRFAAAPRAWLRDVRRAGGWQGGWVVWLGAAFDPSSPYASSAWRRDKGALWDIGPHVLSVLGPALGEVVSLSAEGGAGDMVHLVCRHDGGATSTASLTLSAPPAADHVEVSLWGPAGISTMPPAGTAVDALRVAAQELIATTAAGAPSHPCDVHFGRHVVQLLAGAEELLLDSGATGVGGTD